MNKIKVYLINNYNFVFWIVFIILLFFWQDWLVQTTNRVLNIWEVHYTLAFIIFLSIIFETIWAYWKWTIILNKYNTWFDWLYLVLMLHIVVWIMVWFTLGACINWTWIDKIDKWYQIIMMFPLIELIRHFVVPIMISLNKWVEIWQKKEFLADLFLWIWSFVSFSITWSAMTMNKQNLNISLSNIPLALIFTILALIIFWIFYCWANMVFLYERVCRIKNSGQEIWFFVYIIIISIIALFPFYV